ncbi:SIS domain-containing protein [Streptomyces spongiae]|uniref:D-sedoheptulose-7-phosphate isomerase n=1 Tax=Streptomyces TaxID=1883 RepID=UPI00128BF4B2|nr:SIS domain-containing protein [Streptomyces spongiae]
MEPDSYLSTLVEAAHRIDTREVSAVADRIAAAWARGATVFVAGNGGSAATASHMVCDLAKSATPGLAAGVRVVPLLDTSVLTAWANDVSYEAVFAAQLATQARAGDVLVAITASGSSPNIVQALITARAHGVESVALLGFDGGTARSLADDVVMVHAHHYGVVEDLHLAVNHMITEQLGARMNAGPAGETATLSAAGPADGQVVGGAR